MHPFVPAVLTPIKPGLPTPAEHGSKPGAYPPQVAPRRPEEWRHPERAPQPRPTACPARPMASPENDQDKQLPATERRLRQAREQGQVPRSRDLAHAAGLAAVLGLLVAGGPALVGALRGLMEAGLRFDLATASQPARMAERLAELAGPAIGLAVALGVTAIAVAAASAWLSGGWVFTWQPLMPDVSRLDPLAGLGRIVSRAQLGEMLKACALALGLAVVAGLWLWREREAFAALQAQALPAAFAATGDRLAAGLAWLVGVLAAAALLDVPLQRRLHASRLKMSRHEVREEARQTEGSPEIKARIRQRMREMARGRMMAAVPQADLVVMNPTHYAVALKYDAASAGAPVVVAKGTDLVALRIRDIAREARVPVLRAPPLARALHASTELDRPIPTTLYGAVAQVLAHVFQLREAMAGRAPYPGALPDIAIPPGLDPAAARHPGAPEAAR